MSYLSYEQWDIIADAYLPILFAIALIVFVRKINKRHAHDAWQYGLLLLLSLITAYACMFTDNAIMLWPALGLDYSTHTAVACSLAFPLSLHTRYKIPLMCSLLAYGSLMLYQQYHSTGDLLSTASFMLVFILSARLCIKKQLPTRNINA